MVAYDVEVTRGSDLGYWMVHLVEVQESLELVMDHKLLQ